MLNEKGSLARLNLTEHDTNSYSETDLHAWLGDAGLREIEVTLLTPEAEPPHFQPTLASAVAG